MKETPQESAQLKCLFKNHFRVSGYDAPLPADLERERERFPLEWAEACMEWEQREQEVLKP